jgi:hypothetical protein
MIILIISHLVRDEGFHQNLLLFNNTIAQLRLLSEVKPPRIQFEHINQLNNRLFMKDQEIVTKVLLMYRMGGPLTVQ